MSPFGFLSAACVMGKLAGGSRQPIRNITLENNVLAAGHIETPNSTPSSRLPTLNRCILEPILTVIKRRSKDYSPMELPHQWGKRTKGSDIPKRVKKLDINVLDFLPRKSSSRKLDIHTTASENNGRTIPLDIASSILFQATDLSSLKCLILVNKCFFEAFQISRTSLMAVVAVNMFGESLDWALILADMLLKGVLSLTKPDGTIEFISPPPINRVIPQVLKKTQFIFHVVDKWVELYEVKHLWLNAPKKGKKANGNTKVKKLTISERERFFRGLVVYWIAGYCASASSPPYGYPSMSVMDKSDILGYFSNFELSEIMAVFSFFDDILGRACEECQLEGDDGFLYWQHYCLSKGPFWFLELLDDYTEAFEETYGGQCEGFPLYPVSDEGEKRNLDFEYGDLTDAGHASLASWYTAEGTSGDFRRIGLKQIPPEGQEA
ncbi:hypothetical protein M408DRAFT_12754 [Serendipita vermifera MAFF 305830]|uniref:Uncharacterized protein n=1 Tax=Serendipita vermifera MAFF 305830 TaxID=933852 RepID=A0A0C3APH0_SERVB|nr:hypothetical protein M408DRAFT_12754 [Serendipita vermifera MAFF 305830]